MESMSPLESLTSLGHHVEMLLLSFLRVGLARPCGTNQPVTDQQVEPRL